MMNNAGTFAAKGCITTVIWGSIIGLVAVLAPFMESSDMGPLAVAAMLAAIVAMFLIWGLPEVTKIYTARAGLQTGVSPEKNKRQSGDKLALLMELMDEDERAAFKSTLKQRLLDSADYADGELPYSGETLAALLNEERDASARRR